MTLPAPQLGADFAPSERHPPGAVAHRRIRLTKLFKRARKRLAPHRAYRMVVPYNPPLPLLWCFLPGDRSPASTIHKAFLNEVWRERSLRDRWRLLAFVLLMWPLTTLEGIRWFTFLNGSAIRRRTRKTSMRQALEQLHGAALHGIPPHLYYAFELHDDAKRRRAGEYLSRSETKRGLYGLVKHRRKFGERSVHNKVRYTERCEKHGIPTIPVVAVARHGRLRMTTAAPGQDVCLPRQDLFVKPARGKGGDGAESWRCTGADSYVNSRGDATLTAFQLVEHIECLSREMPYLVNLRAFNHPDLADLSTGPLSTARILSIRNEHGEYEATDAVFRMSVEHGSAVDNFHAGGIAANVDLATGELGAATGLRVDSGWWDRHPTTGAWIRGRRLPHWPAALYLVKRAHAVFPDYPVIGWDIALLDIGPCTVEANGSPDLDIHQRCCESPLGSRRMGKLFAMHVEQSLRERN